MYRMCYRDNRPGRPGLGRESDIQSVNERGKVENGIINEARFHLVPVDVKDVPKISHPRNMVKGGDIADFQDGMNKEETVAALLNAHNVRHYVHKRMQEGGNLFVVMIEFDARMAEVPESSEEATVRLTVTLRSDGLGGSFPDIRRKIHLHANFTDADPGSLESVAASWVGSTFASSPWAPVRGLLPMGIDLVLRHPFYSGMMARAKEMGKKVEIRLYDCSPVCGLRGEAASSDDQVTRLVYFMQSAMMEYGCRIQLSRLPDGYTGEEVDTDPKAVVDIMRKMEDEGKFVGQPLLVTTQERCVPDTRVKEEAFRVEVDDVDMDWTES